jgi:hypothetical protein
MLLNIAYLCPATTEGRNWNQVPRLAFMIIRGCSKRTQTKDSRLIQILYLPLCSGWNAKCYRINIKNLEEQDKQISYGFFYCLQRLVKLINIARPASMPALKSAEEPAARPKAAGIMIGKRGGRGLIGRVKKVSADNKAPAVVSGQDTRVLEAFLAAESEAVHPLKRCRTEAEEDDEEDELQPIGYEPRPEPTPKQRIGDTSSLVRPAAPQSPRVLGPAMPENLTQLPVDGTGREERQPAALRLEETEASAGGEEEKGGELEAAAEKKQRGDRGSRRRKKAEEEEEEEKVYITYGI